MGQGKEFWIQRTGGIPLRVGMLASAITIPRPTVRRNGARIVFDIETESFSDAFSKAGSDSDRIAHAPLPTVACTYHTGTHHYRFYESDDFPALIRELRRAAELVTFNGEGFDHFVIARALGCSIKSLRLPPSADLFRLIRDVAGLRPSLNNLAYLNLGRGKRTQGRLIPNVSHTERRKACKSDVMQTYRLYRLYEAGKLRVPRFSLTHKHYRTMPFEGVCPRCRDVASIVEMPLNTAAFSDGQEADYQKGDFGCLRCTTCDLRISRES
jgi:hypothetical protein